MERNSNGRAVTLVTPKLKHIETQISKESAAICAEVDLPSLTEGTTGAAAGVPLTVCVFMVM